MDNELAPITLFVYNRPIHTRRVIEALLENAEAASSDLYIFSDGPKPNINQEGLEKIEQLRTYLKTISGFKTLHITENTVNKGLANSVADGTTIVIGKHGKTIVLEDDIIVSPYFLRYMNDGLNTYEADDRVISIHAYNYPIPDQGLPSTFFIKGADCQGWATWKSGWDLFERDAVKHLAYIREHNLQNEFDIGGTYPFTQMLQNQIDKKIDSWAICWYASAFINDKYTLYPSSSIINNIGFDNSGIHSGGVDNFNNKHWNSRYPVPVEKQTIVETHKEAFNRWAAYFDAIKNSNQGMHSGKLNLLKNKSKSLVKRVINKLRSNALPVNNLWAGSYSSWAEAQQQCTGYDDESILEKCKEALLKVKNGEAAYERDSVNFDKIEYSWGLLAGLQKAALDNDGKLCVLDFGGSLGSTYFQNKDFLSGLRQLKWCIVEQPHFVQCGKDNFENESLLFYNTIEECLKDQPVNVIVLSSVLQYLERPYEWLEKFISLNVEYIIIDRTAVIDSGENMITVQNVPGVIYKASYPAWFFNVEQFESVFEGRYQLIAQFDNGFTAPAIVNGHNAHWNGFIFKKNAVRG